MKEAPRFDDGEPLKEKPGVTYCHKGSHLARSLFHRTLVKAERIGLTKNDLIPVELPEELPQSPTLPYSDTTKDS